MCVCVFRFLASRLPDSPSPHTRRLHCMCVYVCVKQIHVAQQCANNNHVKSGYSEYGDCFVRSLVKSLECFQWKFNLIHFLLLLLQISFVFHLNQSICINRLTQRVYDFARMFAVCYLVEFQCLRWQLWHCNFIPNNCSKLYTTNPKPLKPHSTKFTGCSFSPLSHVQFHRSAQVEIEYVWNWSLSSCRLNTES